MPYSPPSGAVAGTIATAAFANTNWKDNIIALYTGASGIASQTANDLIIASSATQLGRLAASTGVPYFNSSWSMLSLGTGASWTPTEANISLASATGRHITIGKLTFLFFALTWPSTANSNGAQINGFPVTVRNATVSRGAAACYTNSTASLTFVPIENGTHALVYDDNGTNVTNAFMSGKTITGVAIFEAA